jgi:hypothetical protein
VSANRLATLRTTEIARRVSILAHPFVMVAIMVTTVSLRLGSSGQASRMVAIVLLLTVAPVAAAIRYRRARLSMTDP